MRNPAFSRRRQHLRDRQRAERELEPVHAPGAVRAAPRIPGRTSSSPRRGSWRTVSRSVRCVRASREPESVTRRLVLGPARQIGRRSMPKMPPRFNTRATLTSVVAEIALASQRLQHAVRRHHESEPGTGAERQAADVRRGRSGPDRRARPALPSAAPAPSMASDRSMPTRRAPDLISGSASRPVPHPSSSTAPACWRARPFQNATSRLATVRAFSQS